MQGENAGDRVKIVRESANLSMGELEKASGVSKATISRIERGIMAPGKLTLKAIADGTGANLEWLLTGEGPMYPEKPKLSDREAVLKELRKFYSMTPEEEEFIRQFTLLTSQERQAVVNYVLKTAEAIRAKREQEEREELHRALDEQLDYEKKAEEKSSDSKCG